MALRVSESLTTLQNLASVSTAVQEQPERAPVREQHVKSTPPTLPMNKATEEQQVERPFGHRQRLHKPTKNMFLNSQKESHHADDKQQVTPGEDPKDAGFLASSTPESVCQLKKHIVFLKTHKTASSTIVNILYRYGDTQNLTFGLPVHKYSQFFYPHRFASSYVEGVRSKTVKEYHVICNHLRFNKPEVSFVEKK